MKGNTYEMTQVTIKRKNVILVNECKSVTMYECLREVREKIWHG